MFSFICASLVVEVPEEEEASDEIRCFASVASRVFFKSLFRNASANASASPRRHRVHRGLHENLSLARSTDAAHLEELAGAESAVRVHEGYSRQHGIHQYPGEERRTWWRDRRGDIAWSARDRGTTKRRETKGRLVVQNFKI